MPTTPLRRRREREQTPLALLARAVTRLPDVAVFSAVARVAAAYGRPPDREVLGALRDRVAGALRLTLRALEVHGRNVGYDIDRWRQASLDDAQLTLSEARRRHGQRIPGPDEQVRAASHELASSIKACEVSRMAVPEHLSGAIAHELVIYLTAYWLLGNLV